ncbi:MAG: DUF1549 domain-containing protein, partial [Planctomycetota bacterium]
MNQVRRHQPDDLENERRFSRGFRHGTLGPQFARGVKAGLALLIVLAMVGSSAAEQSMEATVDFESQIKPILEASCVDCHSEDLQESGFRTDNRWDLVEGGDSGEIGVVPGNPSRSYLMKVLTTDDEDLSMPYGDEQLPEADIELIRRWISEGAVWPGQMSLREKEKITLWSMQPIHRPEIPSPIDGQLQRNEVDCFLQDNMQEKGLVPSPPAMPRTLLRRLSVTLTGLYPSPRELAAFEEAYAASPNVAYEDAVDTLLASPHFGERWAQHWLDVIRWGETTGGEANLYRKYAWPYRDYVID